jgi:hypothetical protein
VARKWSSVSGWHDVEERKPPKEGSQKMNELIRAGANRGKVTQLIDPAKNKPPKPPKDEEPESEPPPLDRNDGRLGMGYLWRD